MAKTEDFSSYMTEGERMGGLRSYVCLKFNECTRVQVLYGMDYTVTEQERQHEMLKHSILDHLKHSPETLLVIEEYDKLDCPTRGLLKQLIDSPHSTSMSLSRSGQLDSGNLLYATLQA